MKCRTCNSWKWRERKGFRREGPGPKSPLRASLTNPPVFLVASLVHSLYKLAFTFMQFLPSRTFVEALFFSLRSKPVTPSNTVPALYFVSFPRLRYSLPYFLHFSFRSLSSTRSGARSGLGWVQQLCES
ncbi:hypothetical protein VNO80_17479 [Phaseolus coccineus]|uniref:Uncharacterized protein n=1 Tax=Phaseolus coccineus TaxID=3886 RepID=A0AAN9MHD5_PHACN